MKLNKFRLLVAFLALLFTSIVHASDVKTSNYLGASEITIGAELQLKDAFYQNTETGVRDLKSSNLIHLSFNGDMPPIVDQMVYQVGLKVRAWDRNGVELSSFDQHPVLELSFYEHSIYKELDVLQFSDAYLVELEVISTQALLAGVVQSTFLLPSNVRLTIENEYERYHFLDAQNSSTIQHGLKNSDKDIELSWDYQIGAESYDLEWCFINEYTTTTQSIVLPSDIPDSRFTRVNVQGNRYELSNVYSRGTLYYRVRGVGRLEPNYTHFKRSVWSNESSNQLSFGENERGKLWGYQVSYAENGKKKEVMSYADAMGRSRQAVTRLNTSNTSIIAESFYDFEGRGVISTLPAPDLQRSNSLNFRSSFTRNGSGNAFTSVDFDVDKQVVTDANICGITTHVDVQMATSNGASNYYSADNPDQSDENAYIPDANKYPYTRTVFNRDGSAQLQASPGKTHTYGSGHETRFYRFTPSQEKLTRLFGSEVGYAEHYIIEAVEDANGQMSYSYKNLSGQVIATSLIGDAPTDSLGNNQLDPLSSNQITNFSRNFKTGTLDKANASIVTNEVFMAESKEGVYNFEYTINKPTIYENSCVSGDCEYAYELYIVNDCGQHQTLTSSEQEESILTGELSFPDGLSQTISFEASLPRGEYQLVKKLSLISDLSDETLLISLESCEALIPSEQAIKDQLVANRDPKACETCISKQEFTECDECLVSSIPISSLNANRCAALEGRIRDDMSSGGQYFDNRPYGAEKDDSRDEFLTRTLGSGVETVLRLDVLDPLREMSNWDEVRDLDYLINM